MADLPYGTTFFAPGSVLLPQQLVTDMASWGAGSWIRFQKNVKQTNWPGPVDWSAFDDAVSKCNAAGVNILLPIEGFPTTSLTIDPATGNTVAAAAGNLPNATDVTTFATLIATRYNGQNGHGTANAFQIGNEEWDASAPRNLQSQWLVAVVNSAYPAIKAAYPGVSVGVNAVRKTPSNALAHITTWITNLFTYTGGIGTNADWLDFHYYRNGTTDWDGTLVPDPTMNTYMDAGHATINAPKISLELSTIFSIASTYNPNIKVYCLETGWDVYHAKSDTFFSDTVPVSLEQQRLYLISMLDAMRIGGQQNSKCFVYTDNPNSTVVTKTYPFSSTDPTPTAGLAADESKGITQKISGVYTLLPAFTNNVPTFPGVKEYAATYPSWGPPVLPPVPGPTPQGGSSNEVMQGRPLYAPYSPKIYQMQGHPTLGQSISNDIWKWRRKLHKKLFGWE